MKDNAKIQMKETIATLLLSITEGTTLAAANKA